MRNKLLCLLLSLAVLLSAGTCATKAEKHAYTVAEVESLCDGIVGYKASQWGVSSAQELIDSGLSRNAGESAEFYVIALSQYGSYSFSRYEKALLGYINSHEIYSATTREKYALALIASGSNNRYITKAADDAIGGQGLMSLVFGLHILNNGYESRTYTAESIVNTILGCQLSDGGWAVIGDRGDVDVTAMTLQALAPYVGVYSDVSSAVDRGLTLLSNAQQPNGGFIGMGVENCESTAQVLCALSSLGIDQNTDSRFIKNGNTVLDAMLGYRNSDGSFSHNGSGFNETATMEALYSMIAYIRMCRGQTPLYILDNRHPETVEKDNGEKQNRGGNNDKKQQTPQNQNTLQRNISDTDDQNNNTPNIGEQHIIYIDGQPYAEVTDENGRRETVAVTPTEKKQHASPSSPTTPYGDTDATYGARIFQPSATEAPSTADEAQPAKGGYKPYAIGAVVLITLITALILFLLKKRNKKHYIAVAILAAVAILVILLTNFESVDSYRQVGDKTDAVGTVTLTIRADTISDEEDKDSHIPDDGIILDTTEFKINEGDTAYSILLEASKRYDIRIDNRGSDSNAYISGIQYLYEYEYGDLSGWMYRVNGEFPDVGSQSCTLTDGDRVEWLYTKNIGKDLASNDN